MTEHLEQRLLVLALVILFVVSIVTAILDVGVEWQIPIILLALATVLKLVIPVGEIRSDVKFLRSITEGVKVKAYPNMKTFYEDLAYAVQEARETLDLTHIRDDPPVEFGDEARAYADRVIEWARADTGRSARRLMSLRTEPMREWGRSLVKQTGGAFQVRFVRWDLAVPAINFALVDEKVIFIAITGETARRTRGIAIEDAGVARYFTEYFSCLWNQAEPLEVAFAEEADAQAGVVGAPSSPRSGS